MAYDEKLAERVRTALLHRPEVIEKKMFGGLAFLLNGKMFCGIVNDDLVVRVGPDRYEEVLAKPHVRPMDFTGRPMRGYVFVAPAGRKTDKLLEQWINQGVELVSMLPSTKPARTRRKNYAR